MEKKDEISGIGNFIRNSIEESNKEFLTIKKMNPNLSPIREFDYDVILISFMKLYLLGDDMLPLGDAEYEFLNGRFDHDILDPEVGKGERYCRMMIIDGIIKKLTQYF